MCRDVEAPETIRRLVRDTVRLALVPLLFAGTGAAQARSEIELYRRVVPREATTGVVALHETVSHTLDVPAECEDGSMDCEETSRFARIWRIDFEVETQTRAGDGMLLDAEPRGTAWLALAADPRDEETYDAQLRETLAGLAAAAFDLPWAGLRPDRRPFDGDVALRSAETSWSCFENGAQRRATRYDRTLTVDADGREQVTGTSSNGYREGEIPERVCRALAGAVATGAVQVYRTMSTPRLLLEEVLRVEVDDTLPARLHGDELVPLPDGAWLALRPAPGVEHSTGSASHNEIVTSRVSVAEVETSARILPAALPVSVLGNNAWHSRWTLETVERRLGPLPETNVIDTWSMTMSLLPTSPPQQLTGDDEPVPLDGDPDETHEIRLDRQALFEAVASSLDFRSEVTPDVLAGVIVRKIEGLQSPGWILVLCGESGGPTWGIAPPAGRARLLNGDEFCGAVAGYVPGS